MDMSKQSKVIESNCIDGTVLRIEAGMFRVETLTQVQVTLAEKTETAVPATATQLVQIINSNGNDSGSGSTKQLLWKGNQCTHLNDHPITSSSSGNK